MKSLRKYLGMAWIALALLTASCGSPPPPSGSVTVHEGQFYCAHCRTYHPYAHTHYRTYRYDRHPYYPPPPARRSRIVIEAPLPPPPPLP